MNRASVSVAFPIANSVATRMRFFKTAPNCGAQELSEFLCGCPMTPSDSVSVAFGADCERPMAKLMMVEIA